MQKVNNFVKVLFGTLQFELITSESTDRWSSNRYRAYITTLQTFNCYK